MHLVNWKRISKPKKKGDWGIKNVFWFLKDLATKSFWRSLMVPRLWHEVIHKKYLKKKSVIDWFREGRKNLKGIPNYWRALTSSLPIITDWLAWKPGNGWDIKIGVDPIIGAQSFYKLSKNLISTLHSNGIKLLAQVGFAANDDQNIPRWKSVEILGLAEEHKEECDLYLKGLYWTSIELND